MIGRNWLGCIQGQNNLPTRLDMDFKKDYDSSKFWQSRLVSQTKLKKFVLNIKLWTFNCNIVHIVNSKVGIIKNVD